MFINVRHVQILIYKNFHTENRLLLNALRNTDTKVIRFSINLFIVNNGRCETKPNND